MPWRRVRQPAVKAGVDKLMGTDLENILKDHDIKAVIVTGTSAHGRDSTPRALPPCVDSTSWCPLTGFPPRNPAQELYTAWRLKNAPASVSSHVTLTSVAQITFTDRRVTASRP